MVQKKHAECHMDNHPTQDTFSQLLCICTLYLSLVGSKGMWVCTTFDKGVGSVQGQISYNVNGLGQQTQVRVRCQTLLYNDNMQIQKVLVISIHHCAKVGDVGRMTILLTDDQS